MNRFPVHKRFTVKYKQTTKGEGNGEKRREYFIHPMCSTKPQPVLWAKLKACEKVEFWIANVRHKFGAAALRRKLYNNNKKEKNKRKGVHRETSNSFGVSYVASQCNGKGE